MFGHSINPIASICVHRPPTMRYYQLIIAVISPIITLTFVPSFSLPTPNPDILAVPRSISIVMFRFIEPVRPDKH